MTEVDQRTRCEVTITVTVDGDKRMLSADSTTTGDSAVVALRLLTGVQNDALEAIRVLRRGHPGPSVDPEPGARRRAAVVALVEARGQTQRVEMDTTTTGRVHEAAEALVNAAKDELWKWLHTMETGRV